MNSEPVMTYHVTVGVLGMSLLLAWLLTTAWRGIRNRRVAAAVVGLGWLAIFSSAFTRPPYLTHMSAQAGLGELLYPNPQAALAQKLRLPYDWPKGMELYRLVRHDRAAEIADERGLLPALPFELPRPTRWRVTGHDATSTPAGDGGIDVVGDDSQAGYQIMSPPIPVRPDTRYLMRVKFNVRAGRACAGILSGDQQRWLAPPDPAAPELAFDSGPWTAVIVVIANCNVQPNDAPKSVILLRGGSYASLSGQP